MLKSRSTGRNAFVVVSRNTPLCLYLALVYYPNLILRNILVFLMNPEVTGQKSRLNFCLADPRSVPDKLLAPDPPPTEPFTLPPVFVTEVLLEAPPGAELA